MDATAKNAKEHKHTHSHPHTQLGACTRVADTRGYAHEVPTRGKSVYGRHGVCQREDGEVVYSSLMRRPWMVTSLVVGQPVKKVPHGWRWSGGPGTSGS